MLEWADSFPFFCLLDSANGKAEHYEGLLAVANECFHAKDTTLVAFSDLMSKIKSNKGNWLFGNVNYDMKNAVEKLESFKPKITDFPASCFFIPDFLFVKKNGQWEMHVDFSHLEAPKASKQDKTAKPHSSSLLWQPLFSKEEYMATVELVKQHIVEGDLYEMNLCQGFVAENVEINPISSYLSLRSRSEAPFSSLYKVDLDGNGGQYLLCGSPERFINRKGNDIISQPIKGTRKRGNTLQMDEELRKELANSEKDQAENIMIVDLVRNDLAKICKPGSVRVPELFGLYPFKNVWQMISTIEGELKSNIEIDDIFKATFPMGSMTGAPKVMAMDLIEKYERCSRGVYSGTLGYIEPGGDFDFNVVIRSLAYSHPMQRASFQVGGAIVFDSDAESEYQETLIKAKSITDTFGAL